MTHVRYDSNGNIVILSEEVTRSETSVEGKTTVQRTSRSSVLWNTKNDVETPLQKPQVPEAKQMKKSEPHPSIVETSLLEGRKQFTVTTKSAKQAIVDLSTSIRILPTRTRALAARVWSAAKTPVTLRSKRRQKTRSKGQLFLMDTVRFGGTFALIFGVLFVGMNANSFLQIARAQLALGIDTEQTEALEQLSVGQSILGDAGERLHFSAGSIVRYLPHAGPPDNRLVIPKLNLNVPVKMPPMTSLLNQDWAGFEEDIQETLKHGVVHYPGSARPGQAGNFFVTGHSSYYAWAEGNYKEVFARLHELQIGDTYFVYHNGDKHKYVVTKKYEVRPTDVTVLDQPSTKRLATLMTCTPVGTTLRRLIVQAEEIDPISGVALAVGEKVAAADQTDLFTGLSALPI